MSVLQEPYIFSSIQMVAGGAAGTVKGWVVPNSEQPEWRPESQPEFSTSPVPVQFQSQEEWRGFLIVTFKAQLVVEGAIEASKIEPGDQAGTKLGLSRDQVELLQFCCQEQSLVKMMHVIGRQNRTKFRHGIVLLRGAVIVFRRNTQ